jgi:hypothetical protein
MTKLLPKIGIGAVIAILLAAVGYLYFQYQKANKELQTIKTDPSSVQKVAADEVKKLVAEVGKLVDLPTNEDPTVATISDIDKLKDQPFFAKARNGDKVLIYTNTKKAILYDPDIHKVMDIAPVNIGTSSAQQATQAKIALRNGTDTVGLTNKAETDLKTLFPGVVIASKDNAVKPVFDKTLVIALSDAAKSVIDQLAKSFNATVSAMPAGESKPIGADILIILGKDRAP